MNQKEDIISLIKVKHGYRHPSTFFITQKKLKINK